MYNLSIEMHELTIGCIDSSTNMWNVPSDAYFVQEDGQYVQPDG